MTEEEAIRKAVAHLRSSIEGDAPISDPELLSVGRTNRGHGWFVEFRIPIDGIITDPDTTIVLVRDDGITATMPVM